MHLVDALKSAASESRSGITFVSVNGQEEYLSYRTLYDEALSVLGTLQGHGLNKGDELVIQVEDNRQLLCILWACLLGGIIPVPLSVGIQQTQKQKLLNVWSCLINPYWLCSEEQAERIRAIATDAGMEQEYAVISRRRVRLDDQRSSMTGRPAVLEGKDIAYIQFSSGSTGNPKGVVLSHDNLISNTLAIIDSLAITGSDILLSWMPLTHDMGLIGFHFTGIVAGINTVNIPTPLFIRRPLIWMEKTTTHRATVLYSPNFGFQYFKKSLEDKVRYPWDLSAVRIIVNGAEAIAVPVCRSFASALKPYGLKEHVITAAYGLAEASVAVTVVPPASRITSYGLNRSLLNTGNKVEMLADTDQRAACFVDVGYPVKECSVRICDDNEQTLAEKYIGHIQVTGKNVTAGYYNDPVATRELFTRDGWLRTGDIGFMNEGRLVVVGRVKNMIIINGENHYPHDIEQVIIDGGLSESGKVAACGVRSDAAAREQLIVFILFKGEPATFMPIARNVRQLVMQQAGIYIDDVVPVRKIPKTTSGKVQYFLLKEQYAHGLFSESPALPVMQQDLSRITAAGTVEPVLEIVRQITGREDIHIHSNLFDSGLNSMTAMQLANRISSMTGKWLNIADVFAHPVIGDLLKCVPATVTDEQLPALPSQGQLANHLSRAQQRIWTECQLNRESDAYNIPVVYKITGHFDPALLEKALFLLIAKYEIFRTSFHLKENGPEQRLHQYHDSLLAFEYLDIRNRQDEQTILSGILEATVHKPFELEQPCQARMKLIRVDDASCLMIFVIHHIIADGWSLKRLFEELADVYNSLHAGTVPPDRPVVQYSQYVAWQRLLDNSGMLARQEAYWQHELADPPSPVCLTAKEQAVAHHTVIRTGHYQYIFSADDTACIHELARRYETSDFTVLMTLLNILLYRYTNSKDITVGFEVNGRITEEMETVIGYTLNTLCLRVAVTGEMTFSEVAKLVKAKLSDALYCQQYPFEKLLDAFNVRKEIGYNPLFRILVLYQDFYDQLHTIIFNNCTIERQSVFTKDGFADLVLAFETEKNELRLNAQYNADMYSGADIRNMTGHLGVLLKEVLSKGNERISRLHLLPEAERQLLLALSGSCLSILRLHWPVHQLFEWRAASMPDEVAIYTADRSITYNEVNARANAVAHWLLNSGGIKREDRIGFMTERNEKLVIAILGILKAGAAYVALDSSLPARRCREMADDCSMKYLLADDANIEKLGDDIPERLLISIDTVCRQTSFADNPTVRIHMNDLAYVIYTSGSTGAPKGIMVEHNSLTDYVQQFIHYFNISRDDVFLQQSSVAFDTMIEEVFPALCMAAKIVIAPGGGMDIETLPELITQRRITVISATPLVLKELNGYMPEYGNSLRIVISGGDILYPSYISNFLRTAAVYNTYGPSEAVVCATYHKIDAAAEASLLGTPVAGKHVFILDEHGNLMPYGKIGEIVIGGQLSRGYINRPDHTMQQFISAPFYKYGKLYRTGDLGRFTENGILEFAGRKDQQLKVRGYRIEPGEVEQAICTGPGVDNAVVVYDREQDRLIAFLIVKSDYSEDRLRRDISRRLPVYMIPSRFEVVESLPLTITGKVNKRALAALAANIQIKDHSFSAPENHIELQLLQLIKKVLNIDQIGVTDNLFEYGCDSIKAMRMINLIHHQLKCRLGIRDLYMYPDIRLLAGRVAEVAVSVLPPLTHTAPGPRYPLSPAQKRLWILDKIYRSAHAYNECEAFEMSGSPDRSAIERAFGIISARHEILRTVFREVEGIPGQVVLEPQDYPACFSYHEAADAEGALQLLKERQQRPFDLENGPLYNVIYIKLSEGGYWLGIIMHHIITDDYSSALIVKEFRRLYEQLVQGKEIDLPDVKRQYRDYVRWSNEVYSINDLQQQRDYWLQQFSDKVPVLDLPLDFNRPALKGYEGAAHSIMIDKRSMQPLYNYCKEQQVSLFMLLLSGVSLLFSAYTGQYDMVIGIPVEGRNHPELENIVGLFVNTLPLRIQFNPADDTGTLLHKVKETCLDAFAHQDYPFEQLVEELLSERNPARSPLFDVLVNFRTLPADNTEILLNDIKLKRILTKPVGSKYDLAIFLEETSGGLHLRIEYDIHLFSPERIARMAIHYTNIVCSLPYKRQPAGALDYLTANEKEQLLTGFNSWREALPAMNIVEQVRKRVVESPDSVAIAGGEKYYTYSEMFKGAMLLAQKMAASGKLAAGGRVALLLDRSPDMILAILAVWMAGGAYLPMDADLPVTRLAYMLEDADCSFVIMDDSTREMYGDLALSGDLMCFYIEEELNISGPVNVDARFLAVGENAYVIYTSGSTGEPKGVIVKHRSVINTLTGLQERPGFGTSDVLLSVSSYTFDISVAEFFLPLISGGKLVMATRAEVLDMKKLKALFEKHDPTFMQATPSLWSALVDSGWNGLPYLKIISCGEPLPANLCRMLLCRGGDVWNLYGPTETTIFSAGTRITGTEQPITIGFPFKNNRIYILNEMRQLLPIGVYGELYIGGEGVAEGYLNQPALTSNKFIYIEDVDRQRMYATGDVGRWLADGTIQLKGRTDDQVKIRGFRIEPGEIEQAMLQYPAVRTAAVIVYGNVKEDQSLVAFIVATEHDNDAVDDVRLFLQQRLPAYMIPAHFIVLESMPLNTNGKVDRKSLDAIAKMKIKERVPETTLSLPGNRIEEQLLLIWKKLLNLEVISTTDNFFNIGGHSLKANLMANQIYARLGLEITLADIFIYPTIKQLGGVLSQLERDTYDHVEI